MFLSDTKIKENIKLPWNNKSKDESYQKYIAQLTEAEQEQLFSKYEADFSMFGYSVTTEWIFQSTRFFIYVLKHNNDQYCQNLPVDSFLSLPPDTGHHSWAWRTHTLQDWPKEQCAIQTLQTALLSPPLE